AIDLAASYGPALKDLVQDAYASLRARGHARPRLVIPPPVPTPDPTALSTAREAAARDLATAGDGVRVCAGRDALDLLEELLHGETVPWPGELNAAELKGGAKALTTDACEAYRTAFTTYRAQCADFHAGTAIKLIDALLNAYGAA